MTNSTITTITSSQLEEMTFNVVSCEIEESNSDTDSWEEQTGDCEYETHYRFSNQVWGTATLRSDTDPSITVTINWQADASSKTYADSFDFDIGFNESMSHPIIINATIVDEDGDEVSDPDFELSEKFKGGEWEECHARKLLPTADVEELTETEDTDMTDLEVIEINRDNAPDLKFTGVQIASASSKDPYGSNNGRWTVLRLYRTKGGKFIAQSIGCTQWQGEKDRYAAEVCSNHAEVIKFFGHGRLAKEIYAEADIADIQEVD